LYIQSQHPFIISIFNSASKAWAPQRLIGCLLERIDGLVLKKTDEIETETERKISIMSNLIEVTNTTEGVSDQDLEACLDSFIAAKVADAKKILILPPDITRFYSRAGQICEYLYRQLSDTVEIYFLPALGTHDPMSASEIKHMFGDDIPLEKFLPHFWRTDVQKLGEITPARMAELSEGKLDCAMDVAVNKLILKDDWDLIVSVGQVVPHEVIGMANYTKNVLVGVGGADTIHKSHFLGAVYGMERIMGRASSPVRSALNEGFNQFLSHLPIEFILTVIGKIKGINRLQGVFCGSDESVYLKACELSQKLNIDLLAKPIKKAIVYLDPKEFKTTWLGNKAIYRTRMAMADGGELIILAPGLHRFGEDLEIDKLIRRYGYRSTEETLSAVESDPELKNNLSAAAHLIHGSAEGRFNITYCPKSKVSKQEIESVNYGYCGYDEMLERYPLEQFSDGWNRCESGEEIFYISNPALGLWATKEQF
jgi:nickel-dependent lactate racemase